MKGAFKQRLTAGQDFPSHHFPDIGQSRFDVDSQPLPHPNFLSGRTAAAI